MDSKNSLLKELNLPCVTNEGAMPMEIEEEIETCSEFKRFSCCSADTVRSIEKHINRIESLVYGQCPHCVENVRNLKCALNCSPTQKIHVNAAENASSNKKAFKLCLSTCIDIFNHVVVCIYNSKFIEYLGYCVGDTFT
jgi:hypothetical protein